MCRIPYGFASCDFDARISHPLDSANAITSLTSSETASWNGHSSGRFKFADLHARINPWRRIVHPERRRFGRDGHLRALEHL